jgi:hypothetical protein
MSLFRIPGMNVDRLLDIVAPTPRFPVEVLQEQWLESLLAPTVKPVPGSVVFCDLALGYAEHSGIYVGDGEIVHLNGRGRIERVDADHFRRYPGGIGRAPAIYVSSRKGRAVGSATVAERALQQVGRRRDYNLLLDNCHQFSAGCLSGSFDNPINFLTFLKDEARQHLKAKDWQRWG